MPHKPKPKKKPANNHNHQKQNNTVMVAAPVSKSVRKTATKPKMQNAANGVIVEHTEYFMDVTSSASAFQASKIPINPGIVLAFPWLSSVANRFESYLFERLEFMYKPLCSTTTPGVVILAVDYDAADATPNSKIIANSYAESSSSSVWDTSRHVCKGSNLRKFGIQRYVRTSDQLGTDVRVSDVGNLFICTSNTPATPTQLGEVWVSYKVKLFTPQITATPSALVTQPTNPSGYAQAMKMTTTNGVLHWTGEFFNNAIAVIQHFWTEPDTDIQFDIVFNPAVLGRRFLTFLDVNGGTFGVPPGLHDGIGAALQVYRGIANWAIGAFSGTNDRIFFLDFSSNDVNDTIIPSLRFNYAINQTRDPQIAMFQYDGPFPESPEYNLLSLPGVQPGPTSNNVNWGAFLSQAFEGASVLEQVTDKEQNLFTKVNGKLVQTTSLQTCSAGMIDAISLDD